MVLEIHIFLFAFLFRLLRELEDQILTKHWKNKSFIPNSSEAWTAKWKYPLRMYTPKWYHGFISFKIPWVSINFKPLKVKFSLKKVTTPGITANFEERFPFSSTIFVAITDFEHLLQWVQTLTLIFLIIIASILNSPLVAIMYTFAGLWTAQIIKESLPNID